MEIILVRHGKPVAANNPKVTPSGFAHWIRRYNASLVSEESKAPLIRKAEFENFYVISSNLKRAQHSVKLLMDKSPMLSWPELREMEIPRYKLPFRFKAWTWVYLNRALWMLGIKGSFESFKQAKLRAYQAAEKLVALAQEQNQLIVFGHGYMNYYLRKCLN